MESQKRQFKPKYYVQQFAADSPSIQAGINHQVTQGYKPIFFQVYVERRQAPISGEKNDEGFLLVIFERESK